MFKLNKWVWTASCVFLLSGCASQQLRNNQAMDAMPITVVQDAKYWYQLGRDYQAKKDYSEAINAYEKALELAPEDFEIYNAMGVVYSILDEHELATQLINEAIRHKPMVSYLHNNLGFAYLRWGHASEAAGAFHRALKLDPENSHARHNLATAYEKMGCANNEPCGQWQEPDQP
jgi:Tfp pilus assembly protein PilF